ncbi:hypothetical protein ACF1GT_20055 [Streptomyces sp. NPDC014636]
MEQEKFSRVAVIAGTGVDMDIPNGLIGNGRTGRAQGRPDSPAPLEPARC